MLEEELKLDGLITRIAPFQGYEVLKDSAASLKQLITDKRVIWDVTPPPDDDYMLQGVITRLKEFSVWFKKPANEY